MGLRTIQVQPSDWSGVRPHERRLRVCDRCGMWRRLRVLYVDGRPFEVCYPRIIGDSEKAAQYCGYRLESRTGVEEAVE